MQRPPTILIFDSGAGGLSIAQEVIALRPHCNLIYAADNAMFPYGLMDDAHLIDRLLFLMDKLIAAFKPDITIIACNTASTIALEQLRARFECVFVGVVPAVKPAAEQSKTGVVGLLATPATIQRDYTDALIANFAPHCTVLRHGSHQLVHYAEAEILGQPVTDAQLLSELDKLWQQNNNAQLDTIVLACTHFPLLKKRFQALKKYQHIDWVDSGQAIANRVAHHIDVLKLQTDKSDHSTAITFVYSDGKTSDKTQAAYARTLNPFNYPHCKHDTSLLL